MSERTRIVSPGPERRSVRTASGDILQPPDGWLLLEPGDATLTRRVKAAGPTWTVQEKKGRKTFSHGVWAPQAIVEAVRQQLAAERSTPGYTKRREAEVRRRERQQADYVGEFQRAVLTFLAFDARHATLAEQLAKVVTEHATPVGSGTVARTRRIPVEQRAEAAVIAWMRHRTTAYDRLAIPRVKGQRREVRRQLAQQSKLLLQDYRTGKAVDAQSCPLQRALSQPHPEERIA